MLHDGGWREEDAEEEKGNWTKKERLVEVSEKNLPIKYT
jgi:hypothetical protein